MVQRTISSYWRSKPGKSTKKTVKVRGHAKEIKYTSQQPWEQAYKKKRKSKVQGYKGNKKAKKRK